MWKIVEWCLFSIFGLSLLENIYIQTRSYLEINKRIEILNRRMKLLKELYDVLNCEIKTQGKFSAKINRGKFENK